MNNFKKEQKKKKLYLILIFILLVILFGIDIFTGPFKFKNLDIIRIINADNAESTVFFKMRLPQSLTAVGVGLGLGVCGAVIQNILFNPLASPFTLGISSAASFGAGISLLCGFPLIFATESALLFSILATLFIFYVNKRVKMGTYFIILSGISVKFLFDALLSLVQYKAGDETLGYIVFWIFGSLNKTDYFQIKIIMISFLVCYLYVFKNSWQFTALRFGEERAVALGINTKKLKTISLILISIVTAIDVSFCGVIGFIGLASPHISRKIIGEDQRFHFTLSAFIGAVILLISSILSKTINPGTIIPVGIISSVIGIPFLIYVILDSGIKER